ncbi:MAG: hypothetical protein P8Z81_09115 [Deinococcales bacterium]
MEEAEVKRLAMEAARTTILLADSTKFEKRSFARVCALTDIHTLITDEAARHALTDIDPETVHIEYV